MGRQNPRERMCHSKRRLTKRKAAQLAQRLGLRDYHCPICGQFHITKMTHVGDA